MTKDTYDLYHCEDPDSYLIPISDPVFDETIGYVQECLMYNTPHYAGHIPHIGLVLKSTQWLKGCRWVNPIERSKVVLLMGFYQRMAFMMSIQTYANAGFNEEHVHTTRESIFLFKDVDEHFNLIFKMSTHDIGRLERSVFSLFEALLTEARE